MAGSLFAPEAAAAPRSPAARSTSGAYVEIGGISHISTTEFARRLGMKPVWLQAGKRLALVKDGARIELEVNGREAEVDGLRVFLGEPTRMYRRALYLSRTDAERFLGPMVQPGFNRSVIGPVRIVALDAGHGGRDKGKINERLKVYEKTFALDVVMRTKKILEANGFKVVLTRSDDRFVELEDRPAIAQKAGADVFVSIHFNSVASRPEKVTGVEIYSMTPQYQYSTSDYKREAKGEARIFNPGNTNDPWNSLLGYEVHKRLRWDVKMPDRGHKRQRFAVLRHALCPAILVEAGFLSNDTEARKISKPAYRQDLAEAIAGGIKGYAAAVKESRK